jgi:hypothetical protein
LDDQHLAKPNDDKDGGEWEASSQGAIGNARWREQAAQNYERNGRNYDRQKLSRQRDRQDLSRVGLAYRITGSFHPIVPRTAVFRMARNLSPERRDIRPVRYGSEWLAPLLPAAWPTVKIDEPLFPPLGLLLSPFRQRRRR